MNCKFSNLAHFTHCLSLINDIRLSFAPQTNKMVLLWKRFLDSDSFFIPFIVLNPSYGTCHANVPMTMLVRLHWKTFIVGNCFSCTVSSLIYVFLLSFPVFLQPPDSACKDVCSWWWGMEGWKMSGEEFRVKWWGVAELCSLIPFLPHFQWGLFSCKLSFLVFPHIALISVKHVCFI